MANRFIGIPSTTLLLAILAASTYYGFSKPKSVDTESMLDVSVSIRTVSHVSIDAYGDSVWQPGVGSGFLVSSHNCEVWTNQHVIDNAAVIEVFPRGWDKGHGINATIVNATPHADIAIIRMDSCTGIPTARLGNSDSTNVGDETYVVGNPFGRNPDSISRGIISHTERYLDGPSAYFQTDAAVNPGNSGGALFNREGAVIGLTTAIAKTNSGNNVGIGYALPINTVLNKIAVLRNGPPSWGDAGISDLIAGLTLEEAAIFRIPDGYRAVNITRTPDKGPSAGKLMARDIIYKIDDQAVISPAQVNRIIGNKMPNEIIDFTLLRNGETQVVSVELEDGWKNLQKTDEEAQSYEGLLGMKVEMWSGEEGDKGQFKTPVITKVFSMGPAHLSYIASSQSIYGSRGSRVIPVQVSVNTVTGVVIKGEYKSVSDITTLEQLASKAYDENVPILLEIENWYREPGNFFSPLEYKTTAFHKIQPTPSDQIFDTAKTLPASFDRQSPDARSLHQS